MKKWLIPLLTFILVISSSMCVFAAVDPSIYPGTIPDLPADAQYKTYVVYYWTGSSIRTYATNTNNIINNPNDNNKIRHDTNLGSIWNEEFLLQDGVWVKVGSGTADPDGLGYHTICYGDYVLYSTFDIHNGYTEDVFFSQKVPMTLPERVLNLGITTLNMEVPEVLGAMKILTLCGVGCLALLVSLPILSKVFYRFRARY